jgi:16S rRNA processing protein RimM
MFLKKDCYRLGVISKLHSYKGEVTIYLDVDDPLEYKNLESVFVEYGNKLVPFFLERIAIRPNGQAVVKFEDVETERRAKTILKCGLYLPLDTLPELGDKEFYFHEIEGFEVIDENYGPIGNVIHIIDQTNNPLIAIDHEGIEILVPNQKQFIKLIDRENKRVKINAPEGLLDMYLGSEEEE